MQGCQRASRTLTDAVARIDVVQSDDLHTFFNALHLKSARTVKTFTTTQGERAAAGPKRHASSAATHAVNFSS